MVLQIQLFVAVIMIIMHNIVAYYITGVHAEFSSEEEIIAA